MAIAAIALFLSRPEIVATLRQAIADCIGWLRMAGPGTFFGGMAVLPAVGFPLFPFTLAAGPAFGETMGGVNVALCALAAVAVNVTLSYWLARTVFRAVVQRVMVWMGFRLPELPQGAAWEAAFIVRLVPGLPFCVQSYLMGLMRLPVLPYTVASVSVPAIYIFGVVLGGEALWNGRMKTGMTIAFGAVGALHVRSACGIS